jgi:hypothetical protein
VITSSDSARGPRSSESFYRDLPEAEGFSAVFDRNLYRPVPEDWIVAATDVTNSTEAIVAGRYKDVTIAGAVGTIALANHVGSLDFPFFFGGDGMAFLLPAGHTAAVLALLGDTRETVLSLSGLDLRAGVVPVAELYRQGARLEIARVRVTERYVQAVARGNGMEVVDGLLKGTSSGAMTFAGTSAEQSDSPTDRDVRADFRGFSCRWQDIPSTRGETISLIVTSTDVSRDADDPEGEGILQRAHRIIDGSLEDPARSHPLSRETQQTGGAGTGPRMEARFLTRRTRGLLYALYRMRIWMEAMVVRFAGWSGVPLRGMGKRLDRVREENIRNSDVQKLDGTLKMVLSVSPAERERIVTELTRLQQERLIHFGYHLSDRAVMTCLIHVNHADEVHFVDAADGGYALAARMLKMNRRKVAGS